MIIVTGLGNPGKEYENTPHNVGREIAAAFRKKSGLPEFRSELKLRALVSEGKIGTKKIALVLPETYMNKSGAAVSAAAKLFKSKPKEIFVIHDDADIALGRAKMSFGKRAAGHKGTESVIRALKTKDFWRLRIGIAGKKDVAAEKLILKKWTPEQTRLIKKITGATIKALEQAIAECPEKAMNHYNR